MKLQDWYNENQPSEELIYGTAMTRQMIWVRDTLAGMIFFACKDVNPDFEVWQARDEYLTVESTHMSKSCLLPVYTFTIGNMQIHLRYNFYDWCVKITNTTMTEDQFPEYMKPHFMRGYYEGMSQIDADIEFAVGDEERLYAILWWMLNEADT